MQMLIARKNRELARGRADLARGRTIGFVPTMGDLHPGHLALIRRSKKENALTIVSIFVNPKQFDRKEDYRKYRRTEADDILQARTEGADLLFIPSAKELYPADFQTAVTVEKKSQKLCGPFRPGHFPGVAVVVLKLLHLVQPTRAYFGLKDFQQCKIIEQLVKDLNLSVQIVPCPVVRDRDGLPYSSRNRRLSPEERRRAAGILPALQSVADMLKFRRRTGKKQLMREFRKRLNITRNDRIEYLEMVAADTLNPLRSLNRSAVIATAVWIGKTRLIDNLLIGKTRC